MDIDGYLKEKERQFSELGERIRDPRVFDFNWLPDKPLMRDEIKPIVDALLRYERTGVPGHLLVTGSRGCGKTLALKYLQQLFGERGLPVLYGNCRTRNTSYKLLADFVGARARGFSLAELTDKFTEKYAGPTIVVLDEVDLLSDRGRSMEILYFLSRSPRNDLVVMLSNNVNWASGLDESTRSTLQPETVYFRPYTAAELQEILRDRAARGLAEIPAGVVGQIAALAVKYTSSDVRVAIKTLYYWAADADTPLEESFQRARRDIVVEIVRSLNDKSLLILKAAAQGERPVKQVYRDYRRLCASAKEEPFSYVYFSSTLACLQSLGLVLLITTKIRRAYTRLIQLTFPAEVLEGVWRYRFGTGA